MNKSGIYEILNISNGKRYIGSAINLRIRKRTHFSQLNKNTHFNRRLQFACKSYGVSSFKFKPLIICEKRDLIFFEQRCIDYLKPEYNLSLTAGSRLGVKASKETRKKMSTRMIGNQNMLGRFPSEETRKKLSESHKGKKSSKESILKRLASLKMVPRIIKCKQGHQFTEENSYFSPKGDRYCRTCIRNSSLKYRMKLREL